MPIKQVLDYYLITIKVEPPFSRLKKENYDRYVETARYMRDTVLSEIMDTVDGEVDWEEKNYYKTSDGTPVETLFDALVRELGYEEIQESYTVRIKDNMFGCFESIVVNSFRELIETAYRNPNEFKLISAKPELTPKQKEFLQKVIELGMEELIMKKLTK